MKFFILFLFGFTLSAQSAFELNADNWKLIELFSDQLGQSVNRNCMVTDTSGVTFLVPFGPSFGECGDPHFGVSVKLNPDSNIISLQIVDR